MTASMPYRGENRRLSIGEEVLNAVTHGLGALLGVVGTIILICHARAIGGRLNLVSVAVFGVSMILLYLISCLYHALPRSRGKAVFQVLDHCSIFLVTVGGAFGLTLFGINLTCGIVGIVLNAIDLRRWKKLSLVLYIVMGWIGILALPIIWKNMRLLALVFLVLGGVAYTVGVIFYRQKEKPYRHGIWHFFVLAGTTRHFFTVYLSCCG